MSFGLGFWAAAGAGGGAAAGAYELISSSILGSATSSVSFNVTGLSATYKHLQIHVVSRSDRSANTNPLALRFNGDTGSNYPYHYLEGDGASVSSSWAGAADTKMWLGRLPAANQGANSFAASVIDILDIGGTKNKTVRVLNGFHGSVNKFISLNSGSWLSTAALTDITLLPYDASNFITGSRFSLYGIKG